MLAGLPSVANAQCTDADGDGFFYESACGTPQDCNDASSTTYPDAMELCDGYDNDCSGMIDDDPACVTHCPAPQEVGLTVDVAAGEEFELRPSLAWNGSEYGVVWEDHRSGTATIYFARLDLDGTMVGDETELAPGDHPSLVWTGSEYAVAYADNGIFVQRFDSSGAPAGSPTPVTSSGSSPSLVWTGSNYGLAWKNRGSQDDSGIFFTRLDSTGEVIPGSQVIVDGTGLISPETTHPPDLAWNGGGFGLAYALRQWVVGFFWGDEVYFQALDATGNLAGSRLELTSDVEESNEFVRPSIVWTGSEYGVSWTDDWYRLRFARVDSAGNKIGATVDVEGTEFQVFVPELAWTGNEYGLAWTDTLPSGEWEPFFVRLDESGAGIYGDFQITPAVSDSSWDKALVWNGTGYGIVWDSVDLHFARLDCGPCSDGDGDDSTICEDCDDTDETVYPDAPELCDGLDNDCDGAVDEGDSDLDRVTDCGDLCPGLFNPIQTDPDSDGIGSLCDICPHDPDATQDDTDSDGRGDACDCRPADPAVREPAEVRGVRLAPLGDGSARLEWETAPGADTYSILRGLLSGLDGVQYGACLADGLSEAAYEDTQVPAEGAGFFYVVHGQSFDCGFGTLGWTSAEQARQSTGGGCGE